MLTNKLGHCSMFTGHSVFRISEITVYILGPFYYLAVFFLLMGKRSLYNLEMSPLSVTFVTNMFPSLPLVLYTFLIMSLYMVLCFKISFLIRGHKHTVLFLLKFLFPKLFYFLKVFKLILSFFCMFRTTYKHTAFFFTQSFHHFYWTVLSSLICKVNSYMKNVYSMRGLF